MGGELIGLFPNASQIIRQVLSMIKFRPEMQVILFLRIFIKNILKLQTA